MILTVVLQCYICFDLYRVNSSIETCGIGLATQRYGRCEVVAYYSVDRHVEAEHKEKEESEEGSEQESGDESDDRGDKPRVCIQ
uniref:Uncharacterized protein n=1 Tax=Cucumis melo TaxID=3656 RepID=A0A9I9EIJ9_CUCME